MRDPSLGRIFSVSAWGRGITWMETISPTFFAAAAPASVAAFTAPTSPRTMTVTYPEPIFSYPMRCTLAAFTMASAASMAPTRPRVSMSPSASPFIGNTPPPTVLRFAPSFPATPLR